MYPPQANPRPQANPKAAPWKNLCYFSMWPQEREGVGGRWTLMPKKAPPSGPQVTHAQVPPYICNTILSFAPSNQMQGS